MQYPQSCPWYALAVHAKREQCVASILGDLGFEYFLPTYAVTRKYTERIKVVREPLFPGYLFCRIEAQLRLPVLQLPNVMHLVGDPYRPTPVDESEIESLRRSVAATSCEPWPFLRSGERIRIIAGPLNGVEGVMVEARGCSRLVVSISLLQRSVAVEIDRKWVQPIATFREPRGPRLAQTCGSFY